MKLRYIITALLLIGLIAMIMLMRNRPNEEANRVALQHQEIPDPQIEVTLDANEPESDIYKPNHSDIVVTPAETPAAPENIGPVTATAIIMREDGTHIELSAIDSEFRRVYAHPNETLMVSVSLKNAHAEQGILVETGHGGNINGGRGVASLIGREGTIEFKFSAGAHRGKYPVFIYQGNRQEMLDFYVGDEAPAGQAGPARSFNWDNS